FIGTISFSLYLWHWPVHVFYDALHPDTVTTAAGIGIQAGIILALSLASYYLIENPTRHATWGVREPVYRRFDEIDLVPRGAATILCVGALLLFVVSSNVSSTRATDAANLDPAVVAENGDITGGSEVTRTIVQRDPQTVLTEWSTKVTDGVGVTKLPEDLQKTVGALSKQSIFEPCLSADIGCVVNRPGATRTVAVLGDSHAAMLLSVLRAAFPDWNIHQYAYRLCVTADFPDRFDGTDQQQQKGCADYRAKAIADILADPPDLLILSDSLAWVEPSRSIDQWKAAQKVTYDQLQPLAPTTAIVHLTPVPGTIDNAWERCLGADGSITRCFSRASKVATVTAAQADVAAAAPWVKVVDILPLLCDGDACPPIIGGVPTYLDGNHFSIQFRQAVAPAFASLLLQQLPSLNGQLANG
ncbi:MAG: hypothetical protein KGR18_11230, partial [Acidobacteria bacterium]|nr:hypothetical protein [Acidobacteriota bacterium]